LKEYEQTIVNHTLSQPKFGEKPELAFDTKKLNLAPKSNTIVMFDQGVDFLIKGYGSRELQTNGNEQKSF
jgi:hypothetical protein